MVLPFPDRDPEARPHAQVDCYYHGWEQALRHQAAKTKTPRAFRRPEEPRERCVLVQAYGHQVVDCICAEQG